MSLLKLTVIPASRGKALILTRGQRVEVINTRGTQVLDTWAFNAEDMCEAMSMEHTRSVNSRIYAQVGDVLSSNRRRPIVRMVQDSSPGRHDTLLCSCNRELYKELGCTEYHRNCQDNLHEALGELSLIPPFIPAPLNLFMNVTVASDGAVVRKPPASQPGDVVQLQAEMDVVLVFSSCPQDITPVNGLACQPSDTHYRVLLPESRE